MSEVKSEEQSSIEESEEEFEGESEDNDSQSSPLQLSNSGRSGRSDDSNN